ncbi:MAG: HAD-IA family hydrolase [Acidobacteriia bacterium]|nr:HAD-IA family hydrolase [Terriglobia bacterium]
MTDVADVVFFDAAGTLFKVKGSVGEVYSRIAGNYGVTAAPAAVEAAFRAAFHAKSLQGLSPGQNGIRAEKAWWMDIVRQVFASRMSPEVLSEYFEELFAAFRSARAWTLYDDTRTCLERLRSRGYRLAVISNFDSRLFDILANLEIDSFFEQVVLSWHVAAAKPDPAIFRGALDAMNAAAPRALHVGDSLHEDVAGAIAAGMPVALLDRDGRHHNWSAGPRLENLHELLKLLRRE